MNQEQNLMRMIIIFIVISLLGSTNAQTEENPLEQRVTVLEQEVTVLKQQLDTLSKKLEAGSVFVKGEFSVDSSSGLRLVLEKWYYHTVRVKINTYYAIDVELRNDYSKAIEEVDARVDFKNLLGGHLYSINITPMLKIPAGQTIVDKGSEENKRLLGKEHQMTRLNPSDVSAELIIRKIVFEDGTLLSF